jgi:Na+-translocating ferredoxin:NAD+ oxidoreductase RnfG subunit
LCSRTLPLLLAVVALCGAGEAGAKVFHSRTEALALAFPEADRVEDQTYVLREDQVEAIESLSKCEMETKLVKVYTGYRGEDVLGYAFIDIHNVRTLPEAFLVVLNPEGDVRTLRVLAFHEPLEYKPADRWYSQFEEKSLDNHLRLGRDVHGIVGATLSARATTRGVRRALALYEVVVQNGH